MMQESPLADDSSQVPPVNVSEALGWPFPDRRPHWGLRLLAEHLWLLMVTAWWFVYLRIVYATNSLDLSMIPSPRAVQGLVALTFLVLLAAGPYVRFKPWFDWIRHDRLLHQQARAALRDVRRYRLVQTGRDAEGSRRPLHKACGRLSQALAAGRPSRVYASLGELDGLVDGPRPIGCRGALREYLPSIAIAIFLAQCVRAFVGDGYQVDSGTMLPTLQIGDRLVISKVAYGLGLPFRRTRLLANRWQPRRGDIVVVPADDNPKRKSISRIAALPGDVVQLCDGEVRLNGQALGRERLDGTCLVEDDPVASRRALASNNCTAYREYNGNQSYLTLHDAHPPLRHEDCGAPLSVPPFHVWTVDDNRVKKPSSRLVAFARLEGKAWIIFWSLGGNTSVNKDRMFVRVHRAAAPQERFTEPGGTDPRD